MSTTVTYKGQTLTTVENQTRTLQTAGKYLEDDITLTDVSGGGGGGSTTVTINGGASTIRLFWVDDTLTAHNTTSNPGTITCLSGSLFVFFRSTPEPGTTGPTYTNATIVTTLSLGNRSVYAYADIVQAD